MLDIFVATGAIMGVVDTTAIGTVVGPCVGLVFGGENETMEGYAVFEY